MTPSEKGEFWLYLADVMAYYGKPSSEFVNNVWWEALKGYELEPIKRALSAHVQDADRGQYQPKVADVTRFLGGTSSDRAQLAWSIVVEAMARVGAYQDVDFGDAAVHQAIKDVGGWPTLCRAELEELRHLQHRFMQGYQVYALRGAPAAPVSLAGDRSTDDTYAVRNLQPPQPVHVLSDLRRVDPKLLLPGPVLTIGE